MTDALRGGASHFAYKVRQYLYSLPGKRGIDIPEDRFDQLHQHASAITQAVWGQPPTPEQLQHLHDHTDGTMEQVQAHYLALPHPKAKGISVGEFQQWSEAKRQWDRHVTTNRGTQGAARPR